MLAKGGDSGGIARLRLDYEEIRAELARLFVESNGLFPMINRQLTEY